MLLDDASDVVCCRFRLGLLLPAPAFDDGPGKLLCGILPCLGGGNELMFSTL